MKKIALTIAVLFSISISNIWAEGNGVNDVNEVKGTNNTAVRTIKAPRFARPLVEKWIKEYAKTQPGVEFQIAKGQGNSDLNVVLDDKNFSQIVYFGETAVLPITARSSEAARLLEGKHLNNKKLKQLYFLNEDFDEEVKKNKAFETITVYSGSNATSVASSFAHNFGEESSSFRGKRISGDDLFLNVALQKDPLGVSFNALPNIFDLESRHLKSDDLFLNTALAKDPLGVSFNALPNIFDLKSRHLKEDLSLVGLDVKKDLANSFSDNGTLDELLTALENSKESEVAIEKVGISVNNADDEVNKFLEWVLAQGTKYNHEYGLLNLK